MSEPLPQPSSRALRAAPAAMMIALAGAAIWHLLQSAARAGAPVAAVQGPYWYPLAIALLLLISATALLVRGDGGPAAGADAPDPALPHRAPIAACIIVAHAAAAFQIGFWIGSSLAMLALGRLLGRRLTSPWLIASAVAIPGLIQLAFAGALAVRLPAPNGG